MSDATLVLCTKLILKALGQVLENQWDASRGDLPRHFSTADIIKELDDVRLE